MLTYLKGSPQYKIDSNGIMTIITTWMVLPEVSKYDNVILQWLQFQQDVEEWAGNIGDNYKKPKQASDSREATSFIESDTFTVSDIAFQAASGRTHYEVTFTNVQNVSKMTMLGNVNLQVNKNNEKVKTVSYIIDDKNAVDREESIVKIGDTVQWADDSYMVSNVDYTAETPVRYKISITATDMSYMMIGVPSFSTDGYGQTTANVTWRMSVDAYLTWVKPEPGDDARKYFGNYLGNNDYIVTSVNVSPIGIIGYTVNISAKLSGLNYISGNYDVSATANTGTTIYQSDKTNLARFDNIIGTDATLYGHLGGMVTGVKVAEVSRGDYTVTLTTGIDNLTSKQDISVEHDTLNLDAKMCGWMKGESGEYHPINNPPTTTFKLRMTPAELIDRGFKDADILKAIQSWGKIGIAQIVSVRYTVNGNITVAENAEQGAQLQNLNSVSNIQVSVYVYAQPVGTDNLTNKLFTPWKRKKDLPIYYSKDIESGRTYTYELSDGSTLTLDKELDKTYISKPFNVYTVNVTIAYNTTMAIALGADYSMYYENAIKKVSNKKFTSYKSKSISIKKGKDSTGKDIVLVTCTLQALTGWYWNAGYEDHSEAFIQHEEPTIRLI